MPKVALIQDGTEVARQWVGDVKGCFEASCSTLSDGRFTEFSLHVFTDEEVGSLLDGVAPDEWGCLVFASNALLSGPVVDALKRHRRELDSYLASGGGLVVLHQLVDSLEPLLPDGFRPELIGRASKRGGVVAGAAGARDVLLHYPVAVPCRTLRDFGEAEFRRRTDRDQVASLFFTVLDPASFPKQLKPVLTTETGEVVLARTDDTVPQRVVLATIPLDWYGRRTGQDEATAGLLANAIRYASLGVPRRLVWHSASGTLDELLLRWLSIDGAAAIHSAPPRRKELSEVDRWLLESVEAFVLPSKHLEWVERHPEGSAFLARGGVLASSAADPRLSASRVTALVGRHEEQMLASRLYAELLAVDGWRTVDYAFELRNIVCALSFLVRIGVAQRHGAALEPRFPDLARSIYKRLGKEKHREDIGSSIALVQTLAHLEDPDPVRSDAVEWMKAEVSRREFDVGLPIRGAVSCIRHERDAGFLDDAAAAFAQNLPNAASLAPFVRVFDAVALLDQADLLAPAPATAARLADLSCDALDRFPPIADRGWLSVEATADVTRGLVALYGQLPAGSDPELMARLVGHIATGATALRRALPRYQRSPKGVAWLARVIHALIVADQRFPLGLQRLASLEWPERQTDGAGGGSLSRSLIEQLSIENKRLRERERLLGEQALAAGLGRVIATAFPVAILVGAAVAVTVAIGWSSLAALFANVGILVSVLLGVIGGVFTGLARLNLLARPAATVRDLLAKALPSVSDLFKLKR